MKLKHYLFLITIAVTHLLVCNASAQNNRGYVETGEVLIKETPATKTATFDSGKPIVYDLDLNSTCRTPQKGNLTYQITTLYGKLLSEKATPLSIDASQSKTVHLEIPPQPTGFYKVNFMINTTDYDDTVRRAFGVDIYNIKSKFPKPAGFDDFWNLTKAELARVSPNFRVTAKPDLSKGNDEVYLVEMQSLDNATVRGWLTLPKDRKPKEKLPVYMVLPGYGATLSPPRSVPHFACLSINVRGLGNSRDVIKPTREEFITYHIEDKYKYIYRGAIMDGVRALDFISSRPDLDDGAVYVTGGSMGGYLTLAVAALDQRVTCAAADNPSYSDFRSTASSNHFPMVSVIEYCKKRALPFNSILNNLDYFDLKNFAPNIKAKVIVGMGLLDEFVPPYNELVMYNQIPDTGNNRLPRKQLFIYPNLGHEIDLSLGNVKSKWLYASFHMYDRIMALNKPGGTYVAGKTNNISGIISMAEHPGVKDALFSSKNAIFYTIDLKNNFDIQKDGLLSCEIRRISNNKFISLTSVAVKLAPGASTEARINLPSQKRGQYRANFIIDVPGYTDTLQKIFSVDTLGLSGPKAQHVSEDETIALVERPGVKDACFKAGANMYYDLDLKSHFSSTQTGHVSVEVLTMQNKKLSSNSVALNMQGRASKQIRINLPAQAPGFYKVNFIVNTNDYDDTVRRVFGVDIYNVHSPHPKPANFDEFWLTAREELKAVDPKFRITEKPELSRDNDQVYLIEMQSIGNLTIRGWLTLPKDRKKSEKFPVYLALPGYGADLKPFHNMPDFAALAINVRGQGNSNDVLEIAREEFLTYNINDKNKYIMRGAIMDCVRAVDFIFSRPELDQKSIYSSGGSMGGYLSLILASLDKRVTICTAGNPAFGDFRELVDHNDFPMGSIQRYVADNGLELNKILDNMDYFDLKNFTGNVKCKTLIGIGLLDVLAPPNTELPCYNNIPGNNKKLFIFPNLGHEVGETFGNYTGKWVYDNLGIF